MARTKLEHECLKLDHAVDGFANAMKAKLHEKAREGFYGWNESENLAEIRAKLLTHAERIVAGEDNQAVDVANLAMMVFFQRRCRDAGR